METNFILIEVGCFGDSKEPDEESRLMIRLLKLHGFRVIRASYFQPLLHKYNLESATRAILLTWSNSPVEQLKRDTFIQIIKTLYYRHYLRWHQIYPEEIEQYTRDLDLLVAAIEGETQKLAWIKINGLKSTWSSDASTVTTKKLDVMSIAVVSILFALLGTYLMLRIGRELEVSVPTLGTIYFVILASFFSVLALFWQRAEKISERLFELVKLFFDRTK